MYSRPWKTALLLIAVLAGTLAAAWGDQAPADRSGEPAPGITLTGDTFRLGPDAQARVASAVKFLQVRGEIEIVDRIRRMEAEDRLREGKIPGLEAGLVILDFPAGLLPAAEDFRLAVTLSRFVASEDSGIFERWGNGPSLAVKWLEDMQAADDECPRPTDQAFGQMVAFTEAFFTRQPGSDWGPFPSREVFVKWCRAAMPATP